MVNEESYVTLKIYDTLGQEIATLVDEIQTPGIKSAVWEGTNQSGARVASGIYFYQVQTGDVVMNRKMMFMK